MSFIINAQAQHCPQEPIDETLMFRKGWRSDTHKVGFGYGESQETARSSAIENLIRGILVKISAESKMISIGINNLDEIKHESTTYLKTERIDLANLESAFCTKYDSTWAFLVAVSIPELKAYYEERLRSLEDELNSLKLPPITPPSHQSLEIYYRAYQLKQEIQRYELYFQALGGKLKNKPSSSVLTESFILDRIRVLQKKVPIQNEVDLAKVILKELERINPNLKNTSIRLRNFKRLGSKNNEWSSKFSMMLSNALIAEAKKMPSNWTLVGEASEEEYFDVTMTGSYDLNDGNKLSLRFQLDGSKEKVVGGIVPFDYTLGPSFSIPASDFLNSELSVEENILASTVDNEKLTVLGTTDRGIQSPIFYLGDHIAVKAKVNRPAFITLIYKDANGSFWLMMDKAKEITEKDVNKWVLVQESEFKEPPFGKESIYVIATENENRIRCATQNMGSSVKIQNIKDCIPTLRGVPGGVVADFHIPVITKNTQRPN